MDDPGRIDRELRLSGVAVGYRRHGVLDRIGPRLPGRPGGPAVVAAGIEVAARSGTVTALLGPNGAGKSTLLRSVVGLQPLLAGSATLDGLPIERMPPPVRARRVAVVLTDRIDAGLLTAREVAQLGRYPHSRLTGWLTGRERTIVDRVLARLQAQTWAHRRFAELSDGQQQRVLLARALITEPELLILDEPTSFLDVGARVELMILLHELAAEQGLIVVVSTHEVELALRTAGQAWLIDDGTVRAGTPTELIANGAIAQVFETPAARFDPESRTFTPR
ncbi:ABC transporter ATP-binding protein [Microlunatus speluncae]|uniref:ABC transporter ATP-binding protein n=1 Tax=Microlunatus speluncae TaxID=2594267 RepID=UPI0012664AC8|nr:ABC transporter ATP-binding protein [Microlunatus speluncae]